MFYISPNATPNLVVASLLAAGVLLSIATGKTIWLFSALFGPSSDRRVISRVDDPFYYWLTIGMLALFLMVTLLWVVSP